MHGVFPGVQLHPPGEPERQDCPFTRARPLRSALPTWPKLHPEVNTRICGFIQKQSSMQGVLNLSLFPFDTSMPDHLLVPTTVPLLPLTSVTSILTGRLRAVEPHTPADVDDEAASTFGDVRATVPFFAGPWPYAEVCSAFRLASLFSFARSDCCFFSSALAICMNPGWCP